MKDEKGIFISLLSLLASTSTLVCCVLPVLFVSIGTWETLMSF